MGSVTNTSTLAVYYRGRKEIVNELTGLTDSVLLASLEETV